MISCLMNLSIPFVKIWVFKNVLALMCIQKLFIIIKMMYSGIKLMVLCIAYPFRMRVSALKSRSHEKIPPPMQLKA